MAAGLGAQSQTAQPHIRHADTPEFEAPQPRRREQPAELRAERRYVLNTLMIGAPLTAAFVGLMGTDEGVAQGSAGNVATEGSITGVRTAGGARAEPGPSTVEARGQDGLPTSAPGPVLGADGGAGTGFVGVIEPTPAADASSPDAGIEVSPVLVPGRDVAAEFIADGSAVAGPQVSLTLIGVQLADFEDEPASEAVLPERAPTGDLVPGTDADDVITGTGHADTLIGDAGNDEGRGLAGDDLLGGGVGNDRLFGGTGNDELRGGAGADELHGGAGDDLVLGDHDLGLNEDGKLIFGGPGAAGDDRLFGGQGDDTLRGGEGDDLLDGGAGVDRMEGGPGDDILVIDDINDRPLESNVSPDGGGSDTLRVEQGFADSLFAFAGVSNAAFRFGIDTPLPDGVDGAPRLIDPDIENVVLRGTADHAVVGDARDNVIRGNVGDNALFGGGGGDILRGGAGGDRLVGGAGSDRLHGGADDDILAGAAGDDELFGDAGDDILRGGAGEDRLFGGQGNDTFVIGLSEADATDAIFDHEGVNQIRFQGLDGNDVQATLIGDQLRLILDNNETPVAVVDGYRGNEDAFSGIDLGEGIVPIDDLLAVDEPEPNDPEPEDPPGSDPDDDMLGAFLTGTDTSETLEGTGFNDTIEGVGGDDVLLGGGGDDVLAGGTGADRLEGGAGDDRYLFEAGDFDNEDIIRDHQGENVAELQGFSTSVQLRAVETDGNLVVTADASRLFTVEDFSGNEQAFAGVWVGEEFVDTQQLLEGWQPQGA